MSNIVRKIFKEAKNKNKKQPGLEKYYLNTKLVGKTVSCKRKSWCRHSQNCGGAQPHIYDESECGHCPFDRDAVCIEHVNN